MKNETFKSKIESKILTKVDKISFSEEKSRIKDVDVEGGWKTFSIIDEGTGDTIGTMDFSYPKEADSEKFLKIDHVNVEKKYSGQNFGIVLCEKLIEIAKNNNFDGIDSGDIVEAGGIAVWKKLIDKGYKVNVNPLIKKKWMQFLDIYNKGQIFKEKLEVERESSVFKIYLKE